MSVTSGTKLYFPASSNKALLSVMKNNCVQFVAFKERLEAQKVVHLMMNADTPLLLNNAKLPRAADNLIVHETTMDELKKTVQLFGVYLCMLHEPHEIIINAEFLGLGHGQSWSMVDMINILEKSFDDDRLR